LGGYKSLLIELGAKGKIELNHDYDDIKAFIEEDPR